MSDDLLSMDVDAKTSVDLNTHLRLLTLILLVFMICLISNFKKIDAKASVYLNTYQCLLMIILLLFFMICLISNYKNVDAKTLVYLNTHQRLLMLIISLCFIIRLISDYNQIKNLKKKLEVYKNRVKYITNATRHSKSELFGRNKLLESFISESETTVAYLVEIINKKNKRALTFMKEISSKDESLRTARRQLSEIEATMRLLETEVENLRSDNCALREQNDIVTRKNLEMSVSFKIECDAYAQSLLYMRESERGLITEIAEQSVRVEKLEKTISDSKAVVTKIVDDLTCNICTEPFQRAVALNCSHVFCLTCIEAWHYDCPYCRTPIQSITRVLAINKIVENVRLYQMENTS